MTTLFVADVHLCVQKPAITAGFLNFLRYRAINAKALYILGDLFEVWIGDDDPNPLHHKIATALKMLNQRGIHCYFIHGNRDFLLGQRYAATCGITLLPTQQILELAGHRVVILHGDTLCTNDIYYQRFRRWVHQRWLQRQFLLLPLSVRLRIADIMHTNSIHSNASKTVNIMDVNPQTVTAVLTQTQAAIIIHGHTHRPAIHQIIGTAKLCRRAVLGAWHKHGSIIELSTTGEALIEFPFDFNTNN
ncbi:MAG: UDP-2,3-diacylglucosamine diphosphatase [Sodalis sp. Fse]|nr:MAG: UDP-2,3-diacylglucosamine diphosphatase [Sodalis sp. Fse]